MLLKVSLDRQVCGQQSYKLLCVQRSINLSAQQKKELLAGRHYYLSKMSEVLRQRESLLSALEVILSCPVQVFVLSSSIGTLACVWLTLL